VSDRVKNMITMSDILTSDYKGGFDFNIQFRVKYVRVPYTLGGGQEYIKITTYLSE